MVSLEPQHVPHREGGNRLENRPILRGRLAIRRKTRWPLDAGANDYAAKPLASRNFLARIRATLRWPSTSAENGLNIVKHSEMVFESRLSNLFLNRARTCFGQDQASDLRVVCRLR